MDDMLSQAMALGRLGKFEQAIPLFRQSCRARPSDPRPRLGLARALALYGDLREARSTIAQVIEQSAAATPVIEHAADIYEEASALEDALALWLQLAQHPATRDRASAAVARLYERLNRPEEALHIFGSRPQLQDRPDAQLVEAGLMMREASYSSALSLYRRVSERAAPQTSQYDAAIRGLIQAADRIEDYTLAWTTAADWHGRQSEGSQSMPAFQPAGPEFLPPASYTPKPFCRGVMLLTGLPRSGTTLAAKLAASCLPARLIDEPLLTTHAVGKLAGSAGRADASAVREYYRWAVQQYVGADLKPHWLIDKNPAICGGLPWFLRFVPEAKVLWCARDPRDILVSCFLSAFPHNPFTAGFGRPDTLADQILAISRTAAKVITAIGDRARVIRYEDLARDGGSSMRLLLNSWLGEKHDPDPQSDQPPVDPKFVNSPTYREIQKPIDASRVNRWVNYRPFCEDAFDRLDACIAELGY